jgi:hypothetical protein
MTSTKKDTTYNGWPNYETWNVMLWMDNEEGAYREYREKVQRYQDKKRHFGGIAARAVCEACFGERTPDGVSFNNSRVRWGKIAEAMREN